LRFVARSASPGRTQTGRLRSPSVSRLDGVIVPLPPDVPGESAWSAQMADLVALVLGRRRRRTPPSAAAEVEGETKLSTAGSAVAVAAAGCRPASRSDDDRLAGASAVGKRKWTAAAGVRAAVSWARKVGWSGASCDSGSTTCAAE
jgi:hypothetical protein